MALIPIAATLIYYLLPASIQEPTLVQFMPQILAYLAFALWSASNGDRASRLGLTTAGMRPSLRRGVLTGLVLGSLNTLVILVVYPALGYDISFLTGTPHAQLPVFIMVPWFIFGIALFVELNFRGFLLGRLAALESHIWGDGSALRLSPLSVLISALTFAFDPFMINTFRHLHWIAVWDGLVWGTIWIRTRNLYVTIIAHAVEVIVMYSVVRSLLAA